MLKIGQVARKSRVSVDTVRFYERRGLIPSPARLANGYRVYPETTVKRIQLAKQLQGLGLKLDEIREALAAVDEGTASCETQSFRLEAVLARIDENIAELTRLRRDVAATLDGCRAGTCSIAAFHPELAVDPPAG